MDDHDAYIIHASEDEGMAAALAEHLRSSGLVIWFNSFRPGERVREQMEEGLRRSTVGIVLVSEVLFSKQWAVEELDALYALEGDRADRILPVWMGLSAATVRQHSPMLAMRSAVIVAADGELGIAAEELRLAILARTESLGQLLRAQIFSGFNWHTGPGFLSESLRRYDVESDDFVATTLVHHPDDPATLATVVPMIEVLKAPTAYDGTLLTICGTQDQSSLQVLDTMKIDLGEHEGMPVRLASHVFQMRSVDFTDTQLIYVQALGPYAPGLSPRCPPDRLCWVTGVPVAFGAMEAMTGQTAQAVYFAASSIWTSPTLPSEGKGDGSPERGTGVGLVRRALRALAAPRSH